MSKLFIKQAKEYAKTRPTYPHQLFQFIASTTPFHHLVWDVGTGSGQAAQSLAGIYKNVIATDTSETQLQFAPKLPNVQYRHTPPVITISDLPRFVGEESTVDLVTVAQALHWLDLPEFYRQVRWVLKKPHGVIAAWCYGTPETNSGVDSVFNHFYAVESAPYWDPQRKLVDDGYKGVYFPFEEVVEGEGTGPLRFVTEKLMDLDGFFTYLRSWSAYQTAKEKGIELLGDDVIHKFTSVWEEDGVVEKLVRFPVYLRIGKVALSQK
ncbi:Putative methyltransferase DDB_G0268948 [Linum perenne]